MVSEQARLDPMEDPNGFYLPYQRLLRVDGHEAIRSLYDLPLPRSYATHGFALGGFLW